MKAFYKPVSLYLAIMLLYASISINPSSYQIDGKDNGTVCSRSTLMKSHGTVLFLPHQIDGCLTSHHNLHYSTSGPFDDHSNDRYYLELKWAITATEYLLHIKNRCTGLSISDIIFPFHYFW